MTHIGKVTDQEVLQAYVDWSKDDSEESPTERLASITGQPQKVCRRALERCHKKGFLDTASLSSLGKLRLLVLGGKP